jgi:hypothetical protein
MIKGLTAFVKHTIHDCDDDSAMMSLTDLQLYLVPSLTLNAAFS